MSTVISIKQKSEVFVGRVEDGLKRFAANRRIVVITDANIDRLYHDLVARYEHIIIGHGEGNKNLLTVQNIYARLIEMGADRSTLLLGIGGGIVTDITGYVASYTGIVAGVKHDVCGLVLFDRERYQIGVGQISELRASCFHDCILQLKVLTALLHSPSLR